MKPLMILGGLSELRSGTCVYVRIVQVIRGLINKIFYVWPIPTLISLPVFP